MKALADDKTNVTENVEFAMERVANITRKGENAGYQQCFCMVSFSRIVGMVW